MDTTVVTMNIRHTTVTCPNCHITLCNDDCHTANAIEPVHQSPNRMITVWYCRLCERFFFTTNNYKEGFDNGQTYRGQ